MHALDPPPRTLGLVFGSLECRSPLCGLRLSSPLVPLPANLMGGMDVHGATVFPFWKPDSEFHCFLTGTSKVACKLGDDDLQCHGPFGASVSRFAPIGS
jgi:hypothetical protein